MQLANQPVRACPKPRHKRGKPKRKDRGRITPVVAEETLRRAGGLCEKCGFPPLPGTHADRLELAHLQKRSQGGRGDQPWNIVALCGPSVNSNTCHNDIDYKRRSYRDWIEKKIAELKALYDPADWPE